MQGPTSLGGSLKNPPLRLIGMTASSTSDCALVVMAKAPRPGLVKTRLAQSLPLAAVIELYRCLLDDTVALARSLDDVNVSIMCPELDVEELARATGDGIRIVAQRGEGLAAGLTSVFAHFAAALATHASLRLIAIARICRLPFWRERSRRWLAATSSWDLLTTAAIIWSAQKYRILGFLAAMDWARRMRLRRYWRGRGRWELSVRLHRTVLRHRCGGRLDAACRGTAAGTGASATNCGVA